MILNNLNDILITIAKSNFLCKEAFVGDVYDINAKENKFGCFVATPMTAIRQNIGLITYTYTMYYIDRLTKKEDNLDLVQTDAVNFLKGLIDYVDDIPEIEVGDQTQFTLFRHNFDDWCAGAYIEVSFTVPEGSCGQNDFSVVEDLRTLNVDTNGTYVPSGFDGYNRVVVNVSGTGGDYYEKIDGLTIELDDDDCPVIKADYQLKIMTAESGDIKIGDQIDIDTEDSIVSVTGSFELNGNAVATQSWVQSQGYLTEHQDLSDYALKSEIPSLTGYATQSWVQNQGYMKSQDEQIRIVSGEGDIIIGNQDMTSEGFQGISLNEGLLDLYAGTVNVKSDYFLFNGDDVATQEWVDAQGYLTEHQDLSNYALKSEIPSLTGYVTNTSLANTLTNYATRNWVDEEVERTLSDGGYATQQWVQSQGYLTEHQDISGKMDKSSVWTGTEAQWNALSDTQKASYTIALIKE